MGSCFSTDVISGASGRSSRSAASSPVTSPASRKGRWRKGSEWSSLDAELKQQLSKIQGRMFANGASGVASIFTQQGKKGTNQDAMLVWENFGSRTDTVFCGVFDGHGPYGHMVARRVRDSLPLKLSSHWDVNSDFQRENSISTDNESRDSSDLEEEKLPEIFTTLKESFLKSFKAMDKELRLHPSLDCFCSGTTAVTLVKQGQDLVIGNIGDSRAVLGTTDQNDCLVAVQLTVDLKPNLPKEEERIRKCRGRVFALRDEPEVARVWLPNNDSPGLAMARAFGDFCLKDFGLISVPEISYRRLTERDEFIVLATDGVWDVLSNKEVVEIVASAPTRASSARALVESAVRAWRYKYPTSKIDDCAVVCLYLGPNSNDASTAYIENISDIMTNEKLSEEVKTGGKGKRGEFSNVESNLPSQLDDSSTSAMEGDEWSALEGVSRVNTMLTLPRFNAGSISKKL